MQNHLERLLEKLKAVENELIREVQKKEEEFFYEIHRKTVRFKKEIKKEHRRLVKHLPQYLKDASVLNILTFPVVWLCLVPALFMDLVLSIFQAICFPIYGIPKVNRNEYVVIDRHQLKYLNGMEKLNCVYCGYFNGVVGYVQEISARTEQYWCPIKHARRIKVIHSRYKDFIEYGDGKEYRKRIEEVRRSFDDLK